MQLCVLLVLAVAGHLTLACDFPNGTASAVNWWQCSPTTDYKIYSAAPLDMSGNYQYPIHLDKPMYVALDVDNYKKVFTSSDQLYTDILIWQYTGYSTCKWTSVPTFGMTSNLPSCKSGLPCPVPMGRQVIRLTLDFTVHKAIVSLLTNDAPYQLQYTITDRATGLSACIAFQARAYTKS